MLCSDTTCQGVVEGLEGIDDEVDEIGIAFVKTRNEDYPYRTHDISSFPVLGLYRNGGDFVQYEGRDDLVAERFHIFLCLFHDLHLAGDIMLLDFDELDEQLVFDRAMSDEELFLLDD